jgi:transposase
MTQRDRDRLVALKKAKKGLITQRQAAEEIGQSERHVRRLLKRLKGKGDATLVHALLGRRSNRQLDEKMKDKTLEILRGDVYRGFGPTLAAEYLGRKHDIHAGRETVRGWMIEGKLWRASRQRVEKIHAWRQRRSRVGEMIQWDTSEHAWLEDRGVKLYLISMLDDASSRLHARFVLHDSTEENMRLLWSYIERYGRHSCRPLVIRGSRQHPPRCLWAGVPAGQLLHRQSGSVSNCPEDCATHHRLAQGRARSFAPHADWARTPGARHRVDRRTLASTRFEDARGVVPGITSTRRQP